MRTRICAVMIVLCATALSAKKWSNNVLVGFDFEHSAYNDSSRFEKQDGKDFYGKDPDYSKNLWQNAFLLDLAYVGLHLENGFAARAHFAAGGAQSNAYTGSNVAVTMSAEAGYAFVRTEQGVLAAFGGFGIDGASYTTSYTEGGIKYDKERTLASLFLCADITGIYRLTKHIGVYANIGLHWSPLVTAELKLEPANGSSKTYSKWIGMYYTVAPALGVSISF